MLQSPTSGHAGEQHEAQPGQGGGGGGPDVGVAVHIFTSISAAKISVFFVFRKLRGKCPKEFLSKMLSKPFI